MSDGHSGSRQRARHVLSAEELGADQWLDLACGTFPGLSIDCVREQLHTAWLGASSFADAQVMEVFCTSRTRVVGSLSPAPSGDGYSLGMLLAGDCRSRHAGREDVWTAGDLVLFDTARPFDAVHPASFHVLMWNMPREALAPMLAAPDHSIGVRIAGSAGPGAILGNYVRALLAEGSRCDSITQRGLLTHLFGLVGLTLGAGRAARESRRETLRAVRRQQILTYIESHLGDPRLSAERVALALHMSPRWLHALLEDGEISFAAWVTRRRLEECGRLLRDPASGHLSVADIAFRWGFNHLSTFNRRFRAQYRMAPRDVRRRSE